MDYMDTLTEADKDQDLGSFAMLLLDSEIRHNAAAAAAAAAVTDHRGARLQGQVLLHAGPSYRVEPGMIDARRVQPSPVPDRFSCGSSPRTTPISPAPRPASEKPSYGSAPRNIPVSPLIAQPDHKVGVTSPSGGLKNFFRKRHKSISTTPVVIPGVKVSECEKDVKDDSPVSPSPGSKIRGVEIEREGEREMEMMTRRRKSDDTPERCVRYGSSVPSGYSSSGPRAIPRNIYPPSAGRSGGEGDMYCTSGGMLNNGKGVLSAGARQLFQTCRRSISMRDSPIGPTEFLEMYRSRAYSESRGVGGESVQRLRQRRFSASPPFVCGSWNGLSAFEPRQVIIWRDQHSGTQVFRLPKTHEEEHCEINPCAEKPDSPMYLSFLKFHTCYDVIPTSTKLVVFDTQLNVKKAFYALTYNGIRAAPLWDAAKRDFTGMLTITDFIRVLVNHSCRNNNDVEEIEDENIETWKNGGTSKERMVYIEPESSMYEAVEKLCEHNIHRLPVLDPLTGNILYVLTHSRLLRYVFYFFQYYNYPQPDFMEKSLEELRVGTFENIATVQPDTLLLTALQMLLERRLSALPVVDSEHKLIGLYCKSDVIDLAAEKTYSKLNVSTVQDAINSRALEHEKLEKCLKSESLGEVVQRMVKSEVHRLVIVDCDGRVVGIVSLSDVMRFLVLSHSINSSPDESMNEETRMTMSSCN